MVSALISVGSGLAFKYEVSRNKLLFESHNVMMLITLGEIR